MSLPVSDFYDALAGHYHLIFEDWDVSIERQAAALHSLLTREMRQSRLNILDCACGIGTQAIGLAQRGHRVIGSDLSGAAVTRARLEAAKRGLDVSLYVSDMTSLAEIGESDFDVVAALDNALPHLTAGQLAAALTAIHSKLRPGGRMIASIRDYDELIVQRPTIQPPVFHGQEGDRRIFHRVWDWIDQASYTVHLYLTTQAGATWTCRHFATTYRCLLRAELSTALEVAGFESVRWLMPAESGFYQPLVLAAKGRERATHR